MTKTKKSKKKNSKKKKAEGDNLIGFDVPPKKRKFDEPWYKQLSWLEEPPPGMEKKIRAILGFYEVFFHTIRFRGKDGKMKYFPLACPDYDREIKDFKQGSKKTCPVCLHFQGPHLPDHLNFYGGFKYFFDAFDVTAIEEDEGGRTFGTVRCGKYGRKDIVKATKRNKRISVSDTNKGCLLYWERDKEAEDPKDKEGFSGGRKRKVIKKKVKGKTVFIYKYKDPDGSVRRVKGKPTDFASKIKPETPEQIRETLDRLGLWDELEKWANAEKKKKKKKSKMTKKKDGKKKKKKRRNRDD